MQVNSKSEKHRRKVNREKALKGLIERLEAGDTKLHERTIKYLIKHAGN